MFIRPFQRSDATELASLFFNTIRTVNAKDYNPEQLRAWAPNLESWDMDRWRDSFSGKHVFLAEVNGRLAGFGELEPNGHIDRFYISKDHVGQGVGRFIYAALEEKARLLKLKQLFVEASITAKPFFERMGYVVQKEQVVRRNEVDFINFVMTKNL